MHYLHYSQQYELGVVNLWNKCLVFDNLTQDRFRRQAVLDENFDQNLTWLAFDGKKIVGFIYATKRKFPYLERGLEPDRGWINVLFVDPEYQHLGIGTNLLTRAEKELINLGCKNITVGAYSPNYFFWGIDKDNYGNAINFFERHGFKSLDKHFSMGRNLHGFQIPDNIVLKKAAAEAQGYRFINFDYSYTLDLLNFLKEEFGGGWKRNALIAMQNDTACDVLILVVDKDNKICGCCNRAIDGNPMRIGPIGVAKNLRNLGIGTILFTYAMYEMSKRGLYRVFFVTTDDAGRKYYERQGLKLIRTTIEYKKVI